MSRPAFPFRIDNTTSETMKGALGEDINPDTFVQYAGMTLRDYFAGQALVTLTGKGMEKYLEVNTVAKAAYEVADAMLAERANNKESEQENANS